MKIIFLTAMGIIGYSLTMAQGIDRHVIASGGGTVATPSAQVSFTIGETAIQYLSASGASLSQGFQQNWENSTGIRDINRIDATLRIFPNPFMDFVTIKSNKRLTGTIFRLTNAIGKTIPLSAKEIQQGIHWRISTGHLTVGSYWLTIVSEGYQRTFSLSHVSP
jgi:hypothetical protein